MDAAAGFAFVVFLFCLIRLHVGPLPARWTWYAVEGICCFVMALAVDDRFWSTLLTMNAGGFFTLAYYVRAGRR